MLNQNGIIMVPNSQVKEHIFLCVLLFFTEALKSRFALLFFAFSVIIILPFLYF